MFNFKAHYYTVPLQPFEICEMTEDLVPEDNKQEDTELKPPGGKADFGSTIGPAFSIVYKEPVFYILSFFLLMLVGGACFLLMPPLVVGYFKAIKKHLNGGKPQISDIFSSFDLFGSSLVAFIISVALYIIGIILCIIPGLLVLPLMMLSLLVLAFDDEKSGTSAVSKAFSLLKQDPIGVILGTIIISIIGCIGSIACYIGIFFTAPIIYVATLLMYMNLTGREWKSKLPK